MKRRRKQLGMEDLRCTAETISLRRVKLSREGYNEDGRYFGTGAPLFFYHGSDPATSNFGYLRASSRTAAKAKLRAKCAGFKFYR